MVRQVFDEEVQISSSMVRSVFGQLKANGYSESQILALSRDLAELAVKALPRPSEDHVLIPTNSRWGLCFEVNLEQLGYV
ncbi:MAG TPA: hypothetical protein PK668_04310 [Myxococcota bacterium]|nr:hypothetical protein [Myxococcota bacterium]HRY92083.1 hypothetical protein [Myxococcota bacterium]HSA22141.1 hypothetical protein [Myxococcota bacterium]